MNKFLHCLVFCVLFGVSSASAQQLRIDVNSIEAGVKAQKTNDDALNYIKTEMSKAQAAYGKESIEYLYLMRYYSWAFGKVYQLDTNLFSVLYQEYVNGCKEIMELSGKVNGEHSMEYASDIDFYIAMRTSLSLPALTKEELRKHLGLINKAIQIGHTEKSSTKEKQVVLLSSMYTHKAALFENAAQNDSVLKYFKAAVDIRKDHPVYDDAYLILLVSYAQTTSITNLKEAINILREYEPVIEKNYPDRKNLLYHYFNHLASLYLRNSYIDDEVLNCLNRTERLCQEVFGTLSTEFVEYLLNFRIQAFKILGWNSEIFHILSTLETDTFNKNEKLLTHNEKLYIDYSLEWFAYYESINEYDQALKWLKWTDQTVSDTVLNGSFTNKRVLYHELARFYEFLDPDLCLAYHMKALNFEKRLKKKWGQFPINQYQEITHFYLRKRDAASLDSAEKYVQLSLNEYATMFGKQSTFYRDVLFSEGRLLHIKTKGKLGFNKMWPCVYAYFKDSMFIPPVNNSIFQAYGDILNESGKTDSADLFYYSVYERNPAVAISSLYGNAEKYQVKSLHELYTLNRDVINKLYDRYKLQNNRLLSKKLAEKLFEKNLIYQLQAYNQEAILQASRDKEKKFLNIYRVSQKRYDSLLYTASGKIPMIDSAYIALEWSKSVLVESYLTGSAAKDSNNFKELRRGYSYEAVQHMLAEKECFVDIIRFIISDPKTGSPQVPAYALAVLYKNSGTKIDYLFIEDAPAFEQLQREAKYSRLSSVLLPLIQRLRNYDKVYVNPDGIFNLLNFYALQDENGQYLINKKTFVYVNTIDGIEQKTVPIATNKKAVFLGDPSYAINGNANLRSSLNHIFANTHIDKCSPLPYTKIEIETAADALQKKGWKTTLYSGKRCSEAGLKSEDHADIIHIASHGFYLPESDTAHQHHIIKNNPYLRSGLVLGALQYGTNSLNDNILTAYEVRDMDLKSTSLVVLSACETGKGSIIPGQGIYGIQRAFKIAGAKNVLVSVKKVDDKATQLLMEYFYTNVAAGEDYVSALKNAQLKMMKHPLFNAPEYWSHFILIGK